RSSCRLADPWEQGTRQLPKLCANRPPHSQIVFTRSTTIISCDLGQGQSTGWRRWRARFILTHSRNEQHRLEHRHLAGTTEPCHVAKDRRLVPCVSDRVAAFD